MTAVTETSAPALDAERDTFPKLVRDNARRFGSKVAIREKDLGIWQSYTWSQYFEEARLIALGLASLGLTRGDRVAIVRCVASPPSTGRVGVSLFALDIAPFEDVGLDPAAPYEVEETDVPFARPEGKELLARIYRPKGEASSPLAALVDVHGGEGDPPGRSGSGGSRRAV